MMSVMAPNGELNQAKPAHVQLKTQEKALIKNFFEQRGQGKLFHALDKNGYIDQYMNATLDTTVLSSGTVSASAPPSSTEPSTQSVGMGKQPTTTVVITGDPLQMIIAALENQQAQNDNELESTANIINSDTQQSNYYSTQVAAYQVVNTAFEQYNQKYPGNTSATIGDLVTNNYLTKGEVQALSTATGIPVDTLDTETWAQVQTQMEASQQAELNTNTEKTSDTNAAQAEANNESTITQMISSFIGLRKSIGMVFAQALNR